jgi:hypothetical protein
MRWQLCQFQHHSACALPLPPSLLPLPTPLSQMPSLHDARLSSLLGALMSAAYCIIAVAMSATVKPGPEVSLQYACFCC